MRLLVSFLIFSVASIILAGPKPGLSGGECYQHGTSQPKLPRSRYTTPYDLYHFRRRAKDGVSFVPISRTFHDVIFIQCLDRRWPQQKQSMAEKMIVSLLYEVGAVEVIVNKKLGQIRAYVPRGSDSLRTVVKNLGDQYVEYAHVVPWGLEDELLDREAELFMFYFPNEKAFRSPDGNIRIANVDFSDPKVLMQRIESDICLKTHWYLDEPAIDECGSIISEADAEDIEIENNNDAANDATVVADDIDMSRRPSGTDSYISINSDPVAAAAPHGEDEVNDDDDDDHRPAGKYEAAKVRSFNVHQKTRKLCRRQKMNGLIRDISSAFDDEDLVDPEDYEEDELKDILKYLDDSQNWRTVLLVRHLIDYKTKNVLEEWRNEASESDERKRRRLNEDGDSSASSPYMPPVLAVPPPSSDLAAMAVVPNHVTRKSAGCKKRIYHGFLTSPPTNSNLELLLFVSDGVATRGTKGFSEKLYKLSETEEQDYLENQDLLVLTEGFGDDGHGSSQKKKGESDEFGGAGFNPFE